MVKKLAVVTAAVAATLIALSPLASATTEGHHDHPWGDGGTHQFGLVNLNGTNVCPDVGVAAGLLGVLGHTDRSAVICDADSR